MYIEFSIGILVFLYIFFRTKKKINKYKSIHHVNGWDGVYYYFINKNFKKTGFSNFIEKKKNNLSIEISKISKNKIMYGPYSGTKFVSNYEWSKLDISSKLLGIYEEHIQNKIVKISSKKKFDYFIDLGAAEGFHIISLIKKNYFKKGLAFELNSDTREILKKNAKINNVENKIKFFGKAEPSSIIKILKNNNKKKLFFLIDIEGHEFSLFSKDFCEAFSKSTIIIEEHDFNVKNKKIILAYRKNISKYFKVFNLKDVSKKPFNFTILDKYSDDEKYLMMSEGRPKTMNWVLLKPRK